MKILALDAQDQRHLAELFQLRRAVHEADSPDDPAPQWEAFRLKAQQSHPELVVERLAAWRQGALVGAAVLKLPQVDNPELAECEICVAPQWRRQGVGRALLAELLGRVDAAGRRTVIAGSAGPIPGGPFRDDAGGKFLAAMGFYAGLALVRRRLDVPSIDREAEQRIWQDCQPQASAYECRSWVGVTPDELAGGVAQLVNRMTTDAPTGDLALAKPTLDGARWQADDRLAAQREAQRVGVAARHRPTGAIAAVSIIEVRAPGDAAGVLLTIVDPTHRGHRLGTLVKIELHRLLRERFPALRYVYTGTANTNTQMTAINDRLGFVPYQTATVYQLIRQSQPGGSDQ